MAAAGRRAAKAMAARRHRSMTDRSVDQKLEQLEHKRDADDEEPSVRQRDPGKWFMQTSLSLFGPMAASRIRNHPQLGHKLSAANNPTVPIAYLATVYARVALVSSLSLLFFILVLISGIALDGIVLLLLGLMPLIGGLAMYSFELLRPDMQAGRRKKDLEANLPYALNFMAALSSAGVLPDQVYGSLGRQPVYGEVAVEAARIFRDTQFFSKDLVTAVQDAGRRSPSPQFGEFLQGSVNTVTSGGDFTGYLMAKSEQYAQDARRNLKAFLESMGVMAEAYVVVAAAAPLFLIVIISVMMFLSPGRDPLFFLNILVLLFLPIIHGAFTWLLGNMTAD